MSIVAPFLLELPHGICAGVACGEDDGELLDEERHHAAALVTPRRGDWIGGRTALRRAARAAGAAIEAPILADDRGAPRLPAALAGSISHKHGLAVALVSLSGGWTVGVDLERIAAPRIDITARVLRPAERAAIAAAAGDVARARALMLRFSLKEAIYKAIDPFLRRYVGFQEVEVWPERDGDGDADAGTARVELLAADGAGLHVEAAFHERDGAWLTTARAR